ncbi:MAG: lysophospholipase [Cyanobacteria bacterium RYN_339]|nr:lysophospholipase [Cyanobacteria bacterium RYN_339]
MLINAANNNVPKAPVKAANKPAVVAAKPAPAGDTLATTAPTHADGDANGVAFRTTEPAGKPKAIVVMQQGTYGQPAYWDGMGEKLAASGIKSYALGSRVETARYGLHAEDLDKVVAKARAENPGVPVTVMGVSLGADIAMDWSAEHNPDHLPVVLMSPVVLPKYLGPIDLAKVAIGLLIPPLGKRWKVHSPMSKGAKLTTNPASMEDHLPNAKGMKVPANLFDDVVKMATKTVLHGRSMSGSLLVLEAGADEVALNPITGPFTKLIGSKDKQIKRFPGAAHDLSQEYHRKDVVDALSGFVLASR